MADNIQQRDRELLAARSYREFLMSELASRCSRKKFYSMRAMARDLGLSVSGLSNVLGGKAHFSKPSIQRIASRLRKPEPVSAYFKHLALAEIDAPGDANNTNYLQAKEIRLQHLYMPAEIPHRTINGWSLAPMALTLLLEIEQEMKTDEALQKRLGVSSEELNRMIQELETVGWIEKRADGPGTKIRFMELGNRGNAYEIRSIHRKTIDRALWCMDNMSYEQRYFYSSFFTMFPENAEAVAEQLRKSALSLAEDQGSPRLGQEVYAIGTFLVPLTQRPPE